MLKVFGKSILNKVFEQIHLLIKKYLKYRNTKYSICSISTTKYQIQKVFQIRIWNAIISNTAHLCASAILFEHGPVNECFVFCD